MKRPGQGRFRTPIASHHEGSERSESHLDRHPANPPRTFCRASVYLRFVTYLVTLLALPAPLFAETDLNSSKGNAAFRALLNDYRKTSPGLRTANTDQERKQAVEQMGSFAARFIELAERSENAATALKILREAVQIIGSTDSGALIAWETNRSDFPAGASTPEVRRAAALFMQHSRQGEHLVQVIDRMRYGYRLEFGTCLTSALENNPHREIRAIACLSLAQFLNDRLNLLRLIDDRPDLEEGYRIVFGQNYLDSLHQMKQSDLAERIESLFSRAAGEFGDVEYKDTTVGDMARAGLYDIHHLNIGQIAPDLAGNDENGIPFRLTEYRGKIVLLYFWNPY